ncbi:MAG: hydrogenase maturation protease [Gammaproteobacteria bacterium]|jgi:hydrogenase maturation protease
MTNDFLILGVGNIWRRDDGVGIEAIKLLRQESMTNVDLINGGIDGLSLIDVIKRYQRAIIIDAVDMQLTPGTVKLFDIKEAKIKIKHDALSTHGFGLAEVLGLLEKLGCKTKIKIIGVQPQDISFGEGMTELVKASLLKVVNLCRRIL